LDSIYQNIHQDLIQQCKEKSSKAQFQVYKLYYKAMYNTCLRILNNELEAEDIMQESFLAAFEKIETYSGQVSFGAWLKRIVVNNSLDSLKKKKIEFKSVEDINNIDSPDEEPESNNKSEGYDHEEIAEIMNITSSTSRSQLTRAKKKLSELLTPNSN